MSQALVIQHRANKLLPVKFDTEALPPILNALTTENNGQKLVLEVAVRLTTTKVKMKSSADDDDSSNTWARVLCDASPWTVNFHNRVPLGIVRMLTAVKGTEGLVRGSKAVDSGSPIMIPVGPGTLGRIMNVIGEPIDERGPIKHSQKKPIHADAPEFTDQSTASEVLITGIKVVDLLAPYARGGKIGLFGGAGVGKTVFIQELIVSHLDT